jgi:photosystem II stability/assembly factor-like uncharacterized protein
MRPGSLIAANAVTNMNRRAWRLITAMTAAVVLALPAAGCGTRPPAGQSGPLRAIVTARVTSPGEFQHVAAGPDAAWVTTGNALLRVDRRTDRVRTVLTDPSAALTTVTYGAGSVWAGDGDAGLLKIDPVTGRVEARLRGVGFLESFGYGALWNAGYSRAGPALWRTDPATGRTRAFPLPCLKQFGLAAGAGGVWVNGVCSARGAMPGRPPYFSLVRADPATGQVTARYSATPPPLDIVAGDGAVWASGNGMVIRIDPRTGRTTASIAVPAQPGPLAAPGSGAGLLALTPGSLWATAAAPAGYRVLRISTRTARLAGRGIAVPGTPLDLAASGSTLWVVTTAGLTRIDLVHCAAGRCRPPALPIPRPQQAPPAWLASLRMVSASQGWALAYAQSPNSPNPAAQALLRTGDGGRTWSPATPPAARPQPASGAYPVLLARSAAQAWLALTWLAANGSYGTTPSRTVVFATGDGGRTWTASAPIRSPGQARWMSFADPGHGWLVMDLGSAMGQDPIRIYRTSDGGHRWTLAAASPPPPANQQAPGPPAPGPSGISTACDKTGIVFASPRDGWLTTDCNDLAGALLVSHDGGITWQPQALPIPSGACMPAGCETFPPQFSGRTGLLVIAPGNRTPYLLRSDDGGATWRLLTVPPAARWFQATDLIDASHAVLAPGGPPGQVRGPIGELWFTADGGQTWTAVRQGAALSPDATISFADPIAGFAWNPDVVGVPPLYATTDSGRTWTWSVPRLAR